MDLDVLAQNGMWWYGFGCAGTEWVVVAWTGCTGTELDWDLMAQNGMCLHRLGSSGTVVPGLKKMIVITDQDLYSPG